MDKRLKVLKRALRFLADDQRPHALLELNALLDEYPDFSAGYCARARVFESTRQIPSAIIDYMRALSESKNLNKRNTMRVIQNIMVCTSRLKVDEKIALSKIMREDLGLKDKYWNSDSWSVIFGWGAEQKIIDAQKKVLSSPTGRIANIGKFLLDQNDIEKLETLLSQSETMSGYRTLTTYGLPPSS